MIVTIILIIALICFLLAAFGVAAHIALVPVGLALLTLAWLVTAFPGVNVKSNK